MTQGNIKPVQPAGNPIGRPAADGVTGLHHVALNYPTRAGLAPLFGELDLDDLLSEPAPSSSSG